MYKNLTPSNFSKELLNAESVFLDFLELDIYGITILPKDAQENVLRHLIKSYGVDLIIDSDNDKVNWEMVREVLKQPFFNGRNKGTIGHLENAINGVFDNPRVIEWFKSTPKKRPLYFDVKISGKNGLKKETYKRGILTIEKSKNVRSLLDYIIIDEVSTSQKTIVSTAAAVFLDLRVG